MKSFLKIEGLVEAGLLEEFDAQQAHDVVGGSLIIVVCLAKSGAPAEAGKVQMQDFHF